MARIVRANAGPPATTVCDEKACAAGEASVIDVLLFTAEIVYQVVSDPKRIILPDTRPAELKLVPLPVTAVPPFETLAVPVMGGNAGDRNGCEPPRATLLLNSME